MRSHHGERFLLADNNTRGHGEEEQLFQLRRFFLLFSRREGYIKGAILISTRIYSCIFS